MLEKFVKRWDNQKVMVQRLSRFFNYLDRYFLPRHALASLSEVGLPTFRDLVFEEVKGNALDACLALINCELEGELIDQALLKNVLGIFGEIGMGNRDAYETDFEAFMLQDTADYYKKKAASWIEKHSCSGYMVKVEEHLKMEKERVDHYLHASSEHKLLERAEHELLEQHHTQLLEESGWYARLRDAKVDDLSRMYLLFSRIPKCLELEATSFKQHVIHEGTALVKQAEDAANNIRTVENDTVAVQEHAFVQSVIELDDKYLQYVSKCFANHPLFHRLLKEAFEVFCNKSVAGSTSAELLATFCENFLKRGGAGGKLSDGEIEIALEKVVKLLAYGSDKDLFAEFFRKKLARRLMSGQSTNDDHERSIVSKLKYQYGGQFISKMEGMLKDMVLAREHQTNFENYLNITQLNLGIDISVTVLTTGI